jgi:hypothetical protein
LTVWAQPDDISWPLAGPMNPADLAVRSGKRIATATPAAHPNRARRIDYSTTAENGLAQCPMRQRACIDDWLKRPRPRPDQAVLHDRAFSENFVVLSRFCRYAAPNRT